VDPLPHTPELGDGRGPNAPPDSKWMTRTKMKLILFVLGGAVAGYLYYRVVGCRSGACPITSSPIISTLYGAAMGFLLGRA
jgi:hypothetical protein